MEYVVHDEPRHPAVAVAKGVHGREAAVGHGGELRRVESAAVGIIPLKEPVELPGHVLPQGELCPAPAYAHGVLAEIAGASVVGVGEYAAMPLEQKAESKAARRAADYVEQYVPLCQCLVALVVRARWRHHPVHQKIRRLPKGHGRPLHALRRVREQHAKPLVHLAAHLFWHAGVLL